MDRLARAAIARGLPSRHREIGIADGLDLLHPAAIGAAVSIENTSLRTLTSMPESRRATARTDDVDEHRRRRRIGHRLPLAQPLRSREAAR